MSSWYQGQSLTQLKDKWQKKVLVIIHTKCKMETYVYLICIYKWILAMKDCQKKQFEWNKED